MTRSDVLLNVLVELSGEPPEHLMLMSGNIREKFFTFFESDEDLSSQDCEVLTDTLREKSRVLLA